MVRVAPKPSLREASCCKVEVVKGGKGLRLVSLRSTDSTWKPAACSRRRVAAEALASSDRSNFSSLRPSRWVSRAVKVASAAFLSATSMVQYSWGRKTSISASRSQIRRSATDCTRPADLLPGSLRQSTGERVKPTR
jgi:hypothetical protein